MNIQEYDLTGRNWKGPGELMIYEYRVGSGHPRIPKGTLSYFPTDSNGEVIGPGLGDKQEAIEWLNKLHSKTKGKLEWSEPKIPYKGKEVTLEGSPTFTYDLRPLDEAIRDVVLELNSRGIKTLGSCQGHGDRGFITLPPDTDSESLETVKDELRSIGANNIRLEKKKRDADFVSVTFNSL